MPRKPPKYDRYEDLGCDAPSCDRRAHGYTSSRKYFCCIECTLRDNGFPSDEMPHTASCDHYEARRQAADA